MKVLDELERLQEDALKDEKLRNKLLETRKDDNPLSCFCKFARSLGYVSFTFMSYHDVWSALSLALK